MILDFGSHQMLNNLGFRQWHSIEEAHAKNTYRIQFVESQLKFWH